MKLPRLLHYYIQKEVKKKAKRSQVKGVGMKEVEGEEGGERGEGALVGNRTRGLFGLKPKVSKTDHIPINSPVLLSQATAGKRQVFTYPIQNQQSKTRC